ncbi:hypothetical protein J7J95_02140 [bacterium]|nr:hypothetical protein [bacterium]
MKRLPSWSKRVVFFAVLLLAIVTRFWGLKWGEGVFFHPDENNMGWAVERMGKESFDPEFYAYGQFPLFLSLFSHWLLAGKRAISFPEAIYWLRFWSAFSSFLTVIVAFFWGKYLLGGFWEGIMVSGGLVFLPGLIQAAHFGTTESFLTFAAVFFSLLTLAIYQKPTWPRVFLLGLGGGMTLATKVSGGLFLPAPFFALFLRAIKEKKVEKIFGAGILTLIFFFLFSPFYFLSWQRAWGAIRYETAVAAGRQLVFYTYQFLGTKPFIFQMKRIFPWVLGPFWFLFSLLGVERGIKFCWEKKKISPRALFLLVSFLPWFLVNGLVFAKWTRFMTPILPFFVLSGVWWLKKIKTPLKLFFYLLALLPGIVFFKVYLTPDIRWQVDRWLKKNISPESLIISEGGNVVNFPLSPANFWVESIDFYQLEENRIQQEYFEKRLAEADYILVPSRRVFANYSRFPQRFPYLSSYYQRLFSGQLGFKEKKIFSVFSPWQEWLVGNDLNSEETWTVFDHPTVRLFVREKK